MKIKGLGLALLVVMIFSDAAGQAGTFGFQEATITRKDGSAIRGYLEIAITYYAKINYKETLNAEVVSIKSSRIKSIQTAYTYLENITIDNKERLMTLVSDGQVRLFKQMALNPGIPQTRYGGSFTPYGSPMVIYALQRGEQFTELKKKDFRSKLSELLSDQPSIVNQLSNGKYEFQDIEKIIDEYNHIHRLQAIRRQITARVIDAETKKPIKDARVNIEGTDIETRTNSFGFFQITVDTVDILLMEHPEYELGVIKLPEVNTFQIQMTRLP